jgi:hypothetical protein
VDFSEARDLFVIIFQIPGPICKIMDYGLISKKPRGLNEKCRKLEFSDNCFPKGNPWTQSTSPWTTSGASPRWTTVTVSEEAHRRTAGTTPPCEEPHRG